MGADLLLAGAVRFLLPRAIRRLMLGVLLRRGAKHRLELLRKLLLRELHRIADHESILDPARRLNDDVVTLLQRDPVRIKIIYFTGRPKTDADDRLSVIGLFHIILPAWLP